MSTLKEIVNDIKTRLPDSFTNADKVRWINNKLDKIWPHIVAFGKDTSLKTVVDQEEYTLPSGIRLEHIDMLRISQDETVTADTIWDTYFYKRLNESASGKYYFDAYGGKIGLHPIPDVADLPIELTAKTKPDKFVVDDSDSITDVDLDDIMDPDIQEIFVYDCMSIIAENPPYEDAARAKYFKNKADEIFDLILENELKFKIRYGNKARPNSWWTRR
jgi:hypothetical protein